MGGGIADKTSMPPLKYECFGSACSVDLKPGDCELVVDGGRALQPCRYRLFTHMSCIILYPYSTYPYRGYTHVIQRTLDTLLVYRLTVGTVT